MARWRRHSLFKGRTVWTPREVLENISGPLAHIEVTLFEATGGIPVTRPIAMLDGDDVITAMNWAMREIERMERRDLDVNGTVRKWMIALHTVCIARLCAECMPDDFDPKTNVGQHIRQYWRPPPPA